MYHIQSVCEEVLRVSGHPRSKEEGQPKERGCLIPSHNPGGWAVTSSVVSEVTVEGGTSKDRTGVEHRPRPRPRTGARVVWGGSGTQVVFDVGSVSGSSSVFWFGPRIDASVSLLELLLPLLFRSTSLV